MDGLADGQAPADQRSRINSPARHVRSQQPLVCSETHVPEPDFMVLRGTLGDYADLKISRWSNGDPIDAPADFAAT